MDLDKTRDILHLEEPTLTFGHGQVMEHPKDGLMLFGPIKDTSRPAEIRVGVIGRKAGIERYRRWVKVINGYIPSARPEAIHHLAYPGFKAVFDCIWPNNPICELAIKDKDISDCLYLSDRHEAIYKTVGIFEQEISRYLREEEAHVDLWFVVIPEEIYQFGRPKSTIPIDMRINDGLKVSEKWARRLQKEPSFLPEHNAVAEIYKHEIHFHNQLKARLLSTKAVLQVVRETSLTPEDFQVNGRLLRRVQDPATLAWNLTTTSYFKSSGRPWKIADVRNGVCYVGIVFKRDINSVQEGNACCGAQMFLDSGDGFVFRGAVGPWYSETFKEFHITKEKASDLMTMVIDAYKRNHGIPPKELFIHGRTRFNQDEWDGFRASVPSNTNLVGVRIRDDKNFKLYTPTKEPIMRGMAFLQSIWKGYLWTRGYIPRLQTYPGREVPNPLSIEICKGEADLEQVMRDIMGLTKVNFNACIFSDGYPVTLRFADLVGEILTAAPLSQALPPLPFKHYI